MKEQIYACEPDFLISYLNKIENATAEEIELAENKYNEFANSPIGETEGETAVIKITGPLSRRGPSFLDMLFGFGGTSYSSIINAIKDAESNDSVSDIQLLIDTPGGDISGLDEVFQAVQNCKKFVSAVNAGMIASAGYYIASAADEIVATAPTALTGSIGVVTAIVDFSARDEARGIKRIEIVSRNAPDKRPDLKTSAGREVLQKRADSLENIFISRVAEGRGTTIEDVKENFGRGSLLVAFDPEADRDDATTVGMIDGVIENMEAI